MLIQCPECKFSRTLDESKIPSTAQIATCPRCKTRFHFRDSDYETAQDQQIGRQENQEILSGNPEQVSVIEDAETEYSSPQNEKRTSRSSDTHKEGGRDLWDHIASLGENWEQKDNTRHDGDMNDEYSAGVRIREVPWEHTENFGLVGGFFKTIIYVLTRGRLFFSSLLPQDGPIGKAVIFYFLIVCFSYLVNFLWAKLFSAILMSSDLPADFEQLRASIEQFNQISVWQFFVPIPFNAALTLVILGMLFSLLFRICGVRDATFRRSVRILCYASSGLILLIIPIIGVIMSILFVALSTTQGFAHLFNLPQFRAALIVVPVYFLLVLFTYMLVYTG